jgi:hypothetical protein
MGLVGRCHEVGDGVENHLELGVIFGLECGEFPGEVALVRSISRKRTNARMMAMFTCTARGLRRTLESMATPCSVKAYGRYARPRCFGELITVCDEFGGSPVAGNRARKRKPQSREERRDGEAASKDGGFEDGG